MVPPSNTKKYLRYFNHLMIFAVDRDPRDIFLLEKHVWAGGVVPVANVKDFCLWYKLTREHRKYENDDENKVMRLYFEDLIYHYEETVEKICSFLKIEKTSHIFPKTKFIPEYSISNTKLWLRYPEEIGNIRYIEKFLSEYCYNRFE